MDAKQLFRAVSDKMRADFQITAQHGHMGTRGTAREDVLREFLSQGRLPPKYGLGAGEVVGRVRDVSRQCDVIVYDKIDGLSLIYSEHNQIFPIDSVYGIIEVKSRLSKSELIDSLEKIKSFKKMAPSDGIAESLGSGFSIVRARPKPFGIVFAYSLDNNSLDSLYQNLKEWELENAANLWPNYICVLGEGCVHHQLAFETCIDSERITSEAIPVSLRYGNDSLFKFYCALHDMCAHMRLGPIELSNYFEPGIQIGRFVLSGRTAEVELTVDGKPPVPARLKESTIERIVNWCAQTQKIRYWDILKKKSN
ncbi:DUF6602 domain-containing protein [Caballeronia sordidicola]|uniref:DUF6602 domain-containing protein n=1 Tax=Caballeronia sordidicola TaxID=196367 RepID=UPI0004D03F37|nr:DUF6602 domain-containing protein [Caballeronia sordidicola]